MTDELKYIIGKLEYVSKNPKNQLEKYLSQGKKVVGCFPMYTPQEIVHSSGMIPFGLWGGQVTPTVAGKYNPIFTCSLMRSCLEYGMTGEYKGLTCAIIPTLCDTFRGMISAWRAGVNDIPLIPFIHPQNRQSKAAKAFLADEYRDFANRLQEISGEVLTKKSLEKSIQVYNDHASSMLEFIDLANDHLDVITPKVRHAIMKSAHFMERGEHYKIVKDLIKELNKRKPHNFKGKKIVLTGITAEPDELLDILIDNNIAVVGDDLAQESRQFRTLIPEGEDDPFLRLAEQWLNRVGCSTVHEVVSSRGKHIFELAEKNNADGIAVCLMRFCDVEEYEYPFISALAQSKGVHCLLIEIDQSTQNNEQSRTKFQSFSEMLTYC